MSGELRPELTLAIAAFLDSRRSANTQAAYRADLSHLAAWCHGQGAIDLRDLGAADLARYRSACELEGVSAATVARRLCAISSFGSFAGHRGPGEQSVSAEPVARPVVAPKSATQLLGDDDAIALLAAADRVGERAGLVVRLLMLDGLKVGEVTAADASDASVRRRPAQLRIRGGRHARVVALDPRTASVMRRVLGDRRAGPLLLSERPGRGAARLTRFGVDYLVKQAANEAGLDLPISGNVLRRRFVVRAHARGDDVETIRRNVGHANARTTRRYLLVESDEAHPA
jgi:integrase/recombinase XerD